MRKIVGFIKEECQIQPTLEGTENKKNCYVKIEFIVSRKKTLTRQEFNPIKVCLIGRHFAKPNKLFWSKTFPSSNAKVFSNVNST